MTVCPPINLFADPGSRVVGSFVSANIAGMISQLDTLYKAAGWNVTGSGTISGGSFNGKPYVDYLSQQSTYCNGIPPVVYVGKVKVRVINRGDHPFFKVLTPDSSVALPSDENSTPVIEQHDGSTYYYSFNPFQSLIFADVGGYHGDLLISTPHFPKFEKDKVLQGQTTNFDLGGGIINRFLYTYKIRNNAILGAVESAVYNNDAAGEVYGTPSTTKNSPQFCLYRSSGDAGDSQYYPAVWDRYADLTMADRSTWHGFFGPAEIAWAIDNKIYAGGFIWDMLVSTRPFNIGDTINWSGRTFKAWHRVNSGNNSWGTLFYSL